MVDVLKTAKDIFLSRIVALKTAGIVSSINITSSFTFYTADELSFVSVSILLRGFPDDSGDHLRIEGTAFIFSLLTFKSNSIESSSLKCSLQIFVSLFKLK